MRHVGWLLLLAGRSASPAGSQQMGQDERIAAVFEERNSDFDYLLGDGRFTAQHAEWGEGGGYLTAARIRYYDVHPDRFSWAADVSMDDGATWTHESLEIQARRIGPARSLEPRARPTPGGR